MVFVTKANILLSKYKFRVNGEGYILYEEGEYHIFALIIVIS